MDTTAVEMITVEIPMSPPRRLLAPTRWRSFKTNPDRQVWRAMTKDELIERLSEAAENVYTGQELWDEMAEFVAEWIKNHNDWGDEGAYFNAIAWRREMLPESVTPEQEAAWQRHYGVEPAPS